MNLIKSKCYQDLILISIGNKCSYTNSKILRKVCSKTEISHVGRMGWYN